MDVRALERHAHWQNVYQTRGERDVSWFEESPDISLDLIRATGVGVDESIIDIGGGTSRLVDALVAEEFRSVTVLDLSEKALATSRDRLGNHAEYVNWIVADVTTWQPTQNYDLWHDRAAFHFLTEPSDREAYVECLRKAVSPGGNVIIGTFALNGPERCSGLPVVRYDATSIGAILGQSFKLIETRSHGHRTPGGSVQPFQFGRFHRANS
jgi:SAM-dependent methyltransferase